MQAALICTHKPVHGNKGQYTLLAFFMFKIIKMQDEKLESFIVLVYNFYGNNNKLLAVVDIFRHHSKNIIKEKRPET